MAADVSEHSPGATYLVHGEPDASGQLRELMTKELGWNVQVAQYQEKVELRVRFALDVRLRARRRRLGPTTYAELE